MPKLIGQSVVAVVFAVMALQFPNEQYRTPASTNVSVVRDTAIDLAFAGPVLGLLLFVLWAQVIVAAASNGVNLTDGLDGLATGAATMVAGAFVIIGIWESGQSCQVIEVGRAELLRGARSPRPRGRGRRA